MTDHVQENKLATDQPAQMNAPDATQAAPESAAAHHVQASAQGTVLEQIVDTRKKYLPEIRQIADIAMQGSKLQKSTRSLYEALGAGNRGDAHVIMECKVASPSLGLIRDPYDPTELARIYSKYASAISVLCEPEYFGGDLEDLAAVSASTHLPVLCKDFIIDPTQLVAARYFGADAALLMLSVLDDDQYRMLAQTANDLGLDVLTEAATDEELDRALNLGAKIIGINHRNLHDLSIDIERSRRMAPRIPAGTVIVAESGIRDHRTLREIAPHVSAFLVGSQLSRQSDVDRAVRRLLFGDAKVCGLSTARGARAALANGASFGGFILEETSPRHISIAAAADIARSVPGLDYVFVTRETAPKKISNLVEQILSKFSDEGVAGPHAIQLHGLLAGSGSPMTPASITASDACATSGVTGTSSSVGRANSPLRQDSAATSGSETSFDVDAELERLREIRALVPPQIEIWRALDLTTPAGVSAAKALASTELVDRLVLDSGGGTGKAFDWEQIPCEALSNALLAGGIGPGNAATAMGTGVAGVDLNSRVEYGSSERKNQKDPAKINAALQAVRRPCRAENFSK